MKETITVSDNPIGLVEFLRDFGIEEMENLYAYVPHPPTSPVHHEAWAWLETVRMFDGVVSGPWRVEVDRGPFWLRKTHPKLFVGDPVFFDVYRLDRQRLTKLVNKLHR